MKALSSKVLNNVLEFGLEQMENVFLEEEQFYLTEEQVDGVEDAIENYMEELDFSKISLRKRKTRTGNLPMALVIEFHNFLARTLSSISFSETQSSFTELQVESVEDAVEEYLYGVSLVIPGEEIIRNYPKHRKVILRAIQNTRFDFIHDVCENVRNVLEEKDSVLKYELKENLDNMEMLISDLPKEFTVSLIQKLKDNDDVIQALALSKGIFFIVRNAVIGAA